MPLLEDASTVLDAARGAADDMRLDFLVRMLQALEYLHRREVVHRDLKPSNVLVSDGRLKVLDFGISIRRHESRSASGLAGTLLYMAPELLAGRPADEAADLWAVGMIAFEMLAGLHPLAGFDHERLLDPAGRAVDTAGLPIPESLRRVVAELLEPDPERRLSSASAALDALCRAAGRPTPADGGEIRDSFLQTARLVGRSKELADLNACLSRAEAGRGGTVLVTGESGVGKSRLLDELRARALIRGVLVTQGQAIAEGAGPYHLWRESARRLVLELDEPGDSSADDGGASAGSRGPAPDLRPLARTLDELLGPTSEPLEPSLGRERLWDGMEALLRSQSSPVLILLEDLHWADPESLALLARLTRAVAELPCLLLASWRTDTVPPPTVLDALPAESFMQLRLDRLGHGEMGDLCASILGSDRASPELVALLERESEGNALFLVESLRSLADRAGGLHKIRTHSLPQRISSGGIHQILGRRLERVTPEDLDLLRLAAVAGRRLELDVLARLAGDLDLDRWLARASDAAVLEVVGDSWRFQHDLLRDTVLVGIDQPALRALHRRLAETLETLPETPSTLAALAHHWWSTGDGERALPAAERAGREALAKGAHHKAISWLQKAVGLHRRRGSDGPVIGSLELGLAVANHGLGRLDACHNHLLQALARLGWTVPTHRDALLASSIGLALGRVGHLLSPRAAAKHGGRGRRTAELDAAGTARVEAAKAARLLAETCYFRHDLLSMLHAFLRSTAFIEQGPGPERLASTYSGTALALGLIHPVLGRAHRRRAEALAQDLEDPVEAAYVHITLGGHEMSSGRLGPAEECLRRATRLYDELGDRRRWGQAAGWWAAACLLRGDTATALELSRRVEATGRRRGDPHMLAFGLTYQAEALVRTGAAGDAVPLCREAITALAGGVDPSEEKRALGLLVWALSELDPAGPVPELDAASELLTGIDPLLFHCHAGYVGAAMAAVRMLEAEAGEGIEILTRRALDDLGRYARRFPIGRPALHGLRARYDRHQGLHRKALRQGRKAVASALRLGMPWEQIQAEQLLEGLLHGR